jgi:acyl-CoA synthetase (AMP-forming)/AMP-acid ligase II
MTSAHLAPHASTTDGSPSSSRADVGGYRMDVRTMMRQAVEFNADRPAIITESRTFTFTEAWERGVRLANGLRALGIHQGDRVAGVQDNNLGAADFVIGCAIAGVVRVPLYPRNSREAHANMLEGTQCRFVIADEVYADSVHGMDRSIGCLDHILVRDDTYEDWLAAQDPVDPDLTISGDDWYVIRHSGGTTGRSKGVGYTHHDWLVCCRNWVYPLPRLTRSSAIGHAGPISHASGYLFIPGWLHGAVNVLFGAFDPAKVLSMMREHRITHMWAVPTMLQAMAGHPAATEQEWSDLEAILVGGAPITDATARTAHRVFGDRLYQIFGQTEAVPLTMMGPEEWFGEIAGSNPMRSAGRVLPFVELQIRDEDGRTVLPPGREGEIYARCEAQMREFWGDEELTRTRLVDGWVRTGDIGRLDHNGFLYVLDRADDMIVSGGFNIWPAELETVIAEHPDVIEVAVFAVPDDYWGETPMAVCTVGEGASVSADEIIDLCRTRLGSYKKPSRVEFTRDPLPKSVVGKLKRKALREPHWAGRERRVAGA